MTAPIQEVGRTDAVPLAAGLGFACLAAVATWINFSHFDQTLFLWERVDTWFASDIPRVVSNLTDHTTAHRGAYKHPLFSIMFWPLTWILTQASGSGATAIQALLSLNAFCATMLVWRLLHRLGLELLDLALCLALFLTSAAFMFWFAVPETFPFGTTSILLSLQLLILPPVRKKGSILFEAMLCMASLTITITNWAVGLIAVALRYDVIGTMRSWLTPKRLGRHKEAAAALIRPIAIASLAGGIALAFAFVQNALFGQAGMFINIVSLAGESKFFVDVSVQSAVTRVFDLMISPIVAGDLLTYTKEAIPGTAQERSALSMTNLRFVSVAQITATCAWIVVLLLALNTAVRVRAVGLVVLAALFSSALFMLMHLIYGDVYFLYVAHFVAQYVIICTLALRGNMKWIGRGAVVLVIMFGGWHNIVMLEAARALT